MIDWSECNVVESVPERLGGAWVLKGTRFPLKALFDNLEAGATVDEVADWFDVDAHKLHEVLRFLSRRLQLPEVAFA